MDEREYDEMVFSPLKARLYDAVESYYGEKYEQGYAGYPGSSQSLNADNWFDRVADELTCRALELFEQEGFPVGTMSPGSDEDERF